MPLKMKDLSALQAGVNQLTQGAQATEQDKLRAYLKGEAIQKSMQLANQQAQMQGLKPDKYSVQASESGFGVNPENENLMTLLSLRERQDARDDRDLTKLGERIDKAGIPNTLSAMGNLESLTASGDQGGMLTNPDYQVKSAGPVANFLPQFAKNIGEKVGLMPEGASQEAALIQRLMNADIRAMSGTAVTAYEQGRQNVEKGMSGGGDPNLVKIGIKQMADAVDSAGQNIESSSRPEVVKTYQQQGGKFRLKDYLSGGKSPAAPQTKKIGGKTYVRTAQGWEEQ